MSVRSESMAGLIPGSEEWIKKRFDTYGGSEVSAIVGMNRFMSPFALWCIKTRRAKEFTGNLATEVGQWLEEFVAKKVEEITHLRVQRSNYIYFNDNYPLQHALPDRICYWREDASPFLKGLKIGLEIKTTSAHSKLKDGFPEQYYCQCVQYLSVMEYDVWLLAVLKGNNELHIYALRRSDLIILPEWCETALTVEESEFKALKDAVNQFDELVKNDTPPLMDAEESTANSLEQAFPEAEAGTVINLECNDIVDEYFVAQHDFEEAKEKLESLKNAMKLMLGENEYGMCGSTKITWKNSSKTTIDSKKLKAEMPEVFEKYSKLSVSRIFNIKKGDDE